MKGWPGLEALITIIAIALLAFPLMALTRHPAVELSEAESAVVGSDQHQVSAYLEFRFARVPERFELFQGEDPLVDKQGQEGEYRYTEQVELPMEEGVLELRLRVRWAEIQGSDADTMVEVRIEPDGLNPRSQNVWGQGTVEEWITFDWN